MMRSFTTAMASTRGLLQSAGSASLLISVLLPACVPPEGDGGAGGGAAAPTEQAVFDRVTFEDVPVFGTMDLVFVAFSDVPETCAALTDLYRMDAARCESICETEVQIAADYFTEPVHSWLQLYLVDTDAQVGGDYTHLGTGETDGFNATYTELHQADVADQATCMAACQSGTGESADVQSVAGSLTLASIDEERATGTFEATFADRTEARSFTAVRCDFIDEERLAPTGP